MSLIELHNLSKTYGAGNNVVIALKDLNLSFEKGEFTAIVGSSGSGKSTLLHILGGLDTPTEGYVLVGGANIKNLGADKLAEFRRRNFGFVFQFFNLIPYLTAEENIILPLLMDGKKADGEYIHTLVESLGISSKLKCYPSNISGGEQQRVAIARALSAKPGVVFADEPTGNLDSKTTRDILKVFKDTSEKFGQTTIIVTHDDFVASNCERIVRLQDGMVA